MIVIGLGGLDHNGAACVVSQGVLRGFLELERVTRRKNQGLDSPAAVDALLDRLGITSADHVAVADRTWFRKRASWLLPWLRQRFPSAPVSTHHHHLCHLAAAHLAAPHSEISLVSLDGKGDGLSATGGFAVRGGAPRVLWGVPSQQSIGRLWWAASEFAGLGGHHSAGKTMALAGFGEPVFRDSLARTCELLPSGGFRLRPPYGGPPLLFRQVPLLVSWMGRLAGTKAADGPPAQAHKDMAASVQALTEEVLAHCVAATVARTGRREVAIAGGVALNGLANQRLLDLGLVDALHVPPWTDDRGLAIGAAAIATAGRGEPLDPDEAVTTPFLGPEPDSWPGGDPEFCRQVDGDAALEELVERLVRGEVIGWFEGRDEAGPRALGHRSILASPMFPETAQRLNRHIKRREAWRPFGCSIARDRVGEWFERDGDSPSMLRIVRARPERRDLIPAVLHVDGTSRLHTVSNDGSTRLARLLEALASRGHPPMLLNTSMNGRGEPLVHRAVEAFALAREASLDALVVEGILYARGRP
jgi:carbamoyltransferase